MTPDEIRQGAQTLQERVRSDPTLTALTKQVSIGKLHLLASKAIAEAQASEEATKRLAHNKAVRTAFSAGTTDAAITSSRAARNHLDSIDLADRYAERNVSEMLTTATQLGDLPLRQAIGLKAQQSGWTDVVQQWSADASPAQVEALNQLRRPEPFNAVEMLRYVNPMPIEFSNARSDADIALFIDANEGATV
jgi:hypothetical protein